MFLFSFLFGFNFCAVNFASGERDPGHINLYFSLWIVPGDCAKRTRETISFYN